MTVSFKDVGCDARDVQLVAIEQRACQGSLNVAYDGFLYSVSDGVLAEGSATHLEFLPGLEARS